ncbi:alpha-1,2-fucosyltransferase [Falsihalocynthiibacter sp. S25ZX9]
MNGLPIWSNGMEYSEPFDQIDRPVCITGVPDLSDHDGKRPEFLSKLSDGISRASDITPPDDAYAFVHIRLGDFTSDPKVARKMVQLSIDYYTAAMQKFEEHHGQTRWVLCSDDPQAAIDRLPRNFAIEQSDSHSEFDDLHIMSQSAGGVVANSTFSLWGGLLAQNNNGTVIAPKIWRSDGPGSPKLPEAWIRL